MGGIGPRTVLGFAAVVGMVFCVYILTYATAHQRDAYILLYIEQTINHKSTAGEQQLYQLLGGFSSIMNRPMPGSDRLVGSTDEYVNAIVHHGTWRIGPVVIPRTHVLIGVPTWRAACLAYAVTVSSVAVGVFVALASARCDPGLRHLMPNDHAAAGFRAVVLAWPRLVAIAAILGACSSQALFFFDEYVQEVGGLGDTYVPPLPKLVGVALSFIVIVSDEVHRRMNEILRGATSNAGDEDLITCVWCGYANPVSGSGTCAECGRQAAGPILRPAPSALLRSIFYVRVDAAQLAVLALWFMLGPLYRWHCCMPDWRFAW